jgi:ligand-binding SRPBCC domain-containing protein
MASILATGSARCHTALRLAAVSRGELGFVIRSSLDAQPERVWDRISTMRGVNDELWPVLRMTHPAGIDRLPDDAPTGVRLFRSWILLFGILPIDYDDLTLARIEPGRGFLETSRLLTSRRWEHERTVDPATQGSVLSDRILFEPSLRVAGPTQLRIVRTLFAHRHRRLRKTFGGRPL